VNLHESQGNKQVLANYAKAQAAIIAARQKAAIAAASQKSDTAAQPLAPSQS
jgi:DNA invertase Pin-like site-specific DNA recombinase